MRKGLILPMVMLAGLLGVMSVRADNATVQLDWTPPTHKIANMDCNQNGSALTPDDLARIEYTLEYRVQGAGTWTAVEGPPPAVIGALDHNTVYEFRVGAHWPGGTVLCYTDVLTHDTGDEPEPNQCTGLTATQIQ